MFSNFGILQNTTSIIIITYISLLDLFYYLKVKYYTSKPLKQKPLLILLLWTL